MKQTLFLLLLWTAPLGAQEKVYPTGRVMPPVEVREARHAASWERHGLRIRSLTTRAMPEEFDCRKFGWVPDTHDQGDCGSCHIFSACRAASSAFIKSNQGQATTFWLSPQYLLSCRNTGGCGGGDEYADAQMILKVGCPLESDYGPYVARAGACKAVPKMWKLEDMGMCSQGSGVARTEDIKAALIAHGEVSVAVAADNRFMNYTGGVFKDSGSRSINHAVAISGWKTVGTTTVWLVHNSWGKSWGVEGGYIWMEAGANGIGYDAFWCSATALPPPPPPPSPDPSGTVTITLTAEQVKSVLAQAGQPNVPITESTTLAELIALLKKLEPPIAVKPPAPAVVVPPIPKLPEPIKADPKKIAMAALYADPSWTQPDPKETRSGWFQTNEELIAANNRAVIDSVRSRVAALDARPPVPDVPAPAVLSIERVEPKDGVPGDRVRIFGHGLRDIQAVLFGLRSSPFEEEPDGALLTQVPVGVEFGRTSIVVKTRAGATSNPIPFLVGSVP